MSSFRLELINDALDKAYALTDYHIHGNIDKQFEFRRETVHADEFLTEDEKSEAVILLNENHDRYKILYNEGKKRVCENCKLECLATCYCEHCIRNYLKARFSDWTSGNNDIDD